eukprot:gene24593-biopygen14958
MLSRRACLLKILVRSSTGAWSNMSCPRLLLGRACSAQECLPSASNRQRRREARRQAKRGSAHETGRRLRSTSVCPPARPPAPTTGAARVIASMMAGKDASPLHAVLLVAVALHAVQHFVCLHFVHQGSQDSGAGVARAWRGRGTDYRPCFGLGGAGVARA